MPNMTHVMVFVEQGLVLGLITASNSL